MAKAKKGKLTIEDALVPVEEQPYEIPENWCWTKLESIVSIVTGKKDANYGSEEGEYTFFTCAGEPIRCDGYSFEGESLLLPGNGANVGQVFYYDGKFEAYQRTYVLQGLSSNVDLKYLYYQMLFAWNDANKDKQFGSATNYIKMGNFTSYNVPLPPLAEQQRIVEQIENLFSKLDEAKDNSCEVVEKTRLRKSAILQAAFAGSLTTKWRTENGIEEDSWKTKKLGDIVKPVKDKYDPTKDEILDIPYVGLEHIEKSGGIIGSGSPEEVKSTKTLFNKGDILYGKLRPYLDKHDVVDFDGMCSTDILVYRAENEATARYINYLFGTIDFIDYAVENSSGINLPRTSEKIVSAYEVKIPLVEEQTVICDIMDSMMQRENEVIDVAEDFIEKVDLMKKSILAKAFRGELGTNIADEESSIELLKKIMN